MAAKKLEHSIICGRVGLMHNNPILGAGRGDVWRGGSGAGRDKLPRPPGRGGVGSGDADLHGRDPPIARHGGCGGVARGGWLRWRRVAVVAVAGGVCGWWVCGGLLEDLWVMAGFG
uniref:Uncharacterized protein n=1 Tax=Fagus sylvatica TaxID=28930 RepID=A0A2N9EDX6_FAGSY